MSQLSFCEPFLDPVITVIISSRQCIISSEFTTPNIITNKKQYYTLEHKQ